MIREEKPDTASLALQDSPWIPAFGATCRLARVPAGGCLSLTAVTGSAEAVEDVGVTAPGPGVEPLLQCFLTEVLPVVAVVHQHNL